MQPNLTTQRRPFTRDTSGRPRQSSPRRGVGLITGTMGLAILGMWGNYIARGAFKSGVSTVENNRYLIYDVVAETVMGLTLLAAARGLCQGAPWGRRAAHLGLGMAAYSTVNSLGHSMKNDPSLNPALIGSFLTSVGLLIALARDEQKDASG